MTVELVYDPDCPNVRRARSNLMRALVAAGRAPRWREWDRTAPATPARVRGYGSPTVLVDGLDVSGEWPAGASASCCRIYQAEPDTFEGAPSITLILSRLAANARAPGLIGWNGVFATGPGIVLALVPKLACPACWSVHIGVPAALGLGFSLDAAYLLPLTTVFLSLTVGVFAFRAPARRGYGPFVLGVLAAAVILAGRFAPDADPVVYGGIVALIAASVWKSWPRRGSDPACAACDPRCESLVALEKEDCE